MSDDVRSNKHRSNTRYIPWNEVDSYYHDQTRTTIKSQNVHSTEHEIIAQSTTNPIDIYASLCPDCSDCTEPPPIPYSWDTEEDEYNTNKTKVPISPNKYALSLDEFDIFDGGPPPPCPLDEAQESYETGSDDDDGRELKSNYYDTDGHHDGDGGSSQHSPSNESVHSNSTVSTIISILDGSDESHAFSHNDGVDQSITTQFKQDINDINDTNYDPDPEYENYSKSTIFLPISSIKEDVDIDINIYDDDDVICDEHPKVTNYTNTNIKNYVMIKDEIDEDHDHDHEHDIDIDSDDDEDDIDDFEGLNEENFKYEYILDLTLSIYSWQKPIMNEQNYGAFYPNFQKEILNNPFFKLSPYEFNDMLRKCQWIRRRGIGNKLQSKRRGSYGKVTWNANEKITELDLFAIKLYTDYEGSQRELKKCYRPKIDASQSEMLIYEQRICHFAHWRRVLNTAIIKYGNLLEDRVFYHGINRIMKLEIHPTNRCEGPFSGSTSIEIARGFATKNGIIIKMMSKYPRLGTDYFFDASTISAYPDEKEYLIGFLYSRILHVELGSKVLPKLFKRHQVRKLTCFVISSLIRNHLYSYCENLEFVFNALLLTDKSFKYNKHIQINDSLKQFISLIPECVINEFKVCRHQQKVLKLDTISPGIQRVFYRNHRLSFFKVIEFAPNINELHLFENYNVNEEFIMDFLDFIQFPRPNMQLDTIRVFKYNFAGNSNQFNHSLSINIRTALNCRGWFVYEYHQQNCYKVVLTKHEKN